MDLCSEMLVFRSVTELGHLVGGDGNAGHMLDFKIAFFNYLLTEFLSYCYVNYTS